MHYSIVALAVASTSVYAQTPYGYGEVTSVPTSPAPPASTPSCAPPGSYDAQGQYSCNPAHQYPAGQTCVNMNGCPVLVHGTTTTSGSTTVPSPSATSACPAPGMTSSSGQYSCNPAHSYPAGQTCQLVNGCYFLVTGTTPSGPATTPSPSATPACPAAGTTNAMGQYSCNPAHSYPAGQTCQLVDGCYVLVTGTTPSGPATTPVPAATPSPSATPACPAAGTTNAMGQYSCNPAHSYPAGQTCQLVDGCYVLVSGGSPGAPYGGGNATMPMPTGTGVSPSGPGSTGTTPYVGGASYTGALSGFGAIVAGVIAFVL